MACRFAFVNFHDETEARKARGHCANGAGRIKNAKIFCDWANKRRPREERRPRESTADKLRRTGLQWEYRWISEQELEEFRAQREEEQEEAEAIATAAALAAAADDDDDAAADVGVGGATEEARILAAEAGGGGGAAALAPSGSSEMLNGLVAYASDSDADEASAGEDGEAGERSPPPGPPPKIEGPFATQTMIEWEDQGFFVGGHVLVRQRGDGPDDWDEIGEIDFSLFP